MINLHGKGMTTGNIANHLVEVYYTDVPRDPRWKSLQNTLAMIHRELDDAR